MLCAPPAWSYDFVVNSTADAVDAVPGDNQCLTAAGECTLRAAIMEANFGFASILVPAGFYLVSLPGSGEDAAATGDLDILAQVSITGAGQGLTEIAGSRDRVFDVRPGASLSLVDASVTGGIGVDDGCGIRNQGTLSLTRVRFADNGFAGIAASCVHGGAIFNSGSLDITDGLFENNAAPRTTASVPQGGAVYSTGMANVVRAVFRANIAREGAAWYQSGATASALFADVRVTAHTNQLPVTILDGLVDWQAGSIDGNVFSSGGTYGAMSISGGTVYLTNVTVSGNTALSGAILLNGGSLDLHYVTVSANQARQGGRGAGVRVVGGTLTSRDSVIAGNFNSLNGTDIDCEGVLGSQGYNLLGSSLGCTFAAQPTDLIGVAPLLGALADNGGPSPTHALLAGSPAIDAIPAVSCVSFDQRGIARPQGGGCDIGAYEFTDTIFKNGFD